MRLAEKQDSQEYQGLLKTMAIYGVFDRLGVLSFGSDQVHRLPAVEGYAGFGLYIVV